MYLQLKPGREKNALQRHPWIFSGALQTCKGPVKNGALVSVRDSKGKFVAKGVFCESSQISVRLLTWDENEEIDQGFWTRIVDQAVAARPHAATRLLFAEADGAPGCIADRYGDWVVIQFLSLTSEIYREQILQAIIARVQPKGIFERSEGEGRKKEALEPRVGVVYGAEPPAHIEIEEEGVKILVDIREGQKTGYYLDQRESRKAIAAYAPGKTVLNAFCYTGSFGLHAARAGAAAVVNIDASAGALEMAKQNAEINGVSNQEYVAGDAFEVLRKYRDEGRKFDLVILDPPKFASNQKHVAKAARGYKDLNLLGMQLLNRGGVLATFSCSGAISAELFQKILFSAAVDAGRPAQIIERLTQSADHPVLLTFPESEYLKGALVRVN